MKTIIFAAMTALTTTAFAATQGLLTLTGVVDVRYEISLSTSSASVNITGGEANRVVAQATEVSNNLTGYKILMKSQNAGRLRNASDATKFVAYTISYDDTATQYSLLTTDTVVKPATALAGLTTDVSNIRVSFPAQPNAPAGTYSDLITVSISAP